MKSEELRRNGEVRRMEAKGKMSNVEVQMTKSKWRDLWESGKTSSERELYFFDNHYHATSRKKPSFGLKEA